MFLNYRHFRRMNNFCARWVAQGVSAIAETSMILPIPWVTPQLAGPFWANL
jgi:hypothetical protein